MTIALRSGVVAAGASVGLLCVAEGHGRWTVRDADGRTATLTATEQRAFVVRLTCAGAALVSHVSKLIPSSTPRLGRA